MGVLALVLVGVARGTVVPPATQRLDVGGAVAKALLENGVRAEPVSQPRRGPVDSFNSGSIDFEGAPRHGAMGFAEVAAQLVKPAGAS